MANDSLKESVLGQWHLPQLDFRADYARFDPDYARFLRIRVMEVYGSSVTPRVGDHYLICGQYSLEEHEPVIPGKKADYFLSVCYGEDVASQMVKVYPTAANTTSISIQADLAPPSGEFAAACQVTQVMEPRIARIDLMIDSDEYRIELYLND